ncbi:TPA: orotidine-5'-phosphate decarboxylase, partial [Candidatus Woesearchaeota archaeon]|nr:orotidine-5'-phosphate decarboxylase [Candidatus Woesearchaeota archaeon]
AAGIEGRNVIGEIRAAMGQEEPSIFLDLKLHDTPNTVYQAAKAAAVPGVYMMDVHIAGGEEMCKAALRGVEDGARGYGIPTPKVIGVTVLTSLDSKDLWRQNISFLYDEQVATMAELAQRWGLDGIVCPANKAGAMEREFGSWLYTTPGVKFDGNEGTGQKQLYTPALAVQDCASSILVVGSAITKAKDKPGTGYRILQSMAPHV